MNEMHLLLADTATRLFAALTGDFARDWAEIEAAGLANVLLPESAGGFGGTWSDAAIVLRAQGAAAAASPLAEVMLARRLAHDAGFVASPLLTVAQFAEGSVDDAGRFTGKLRGVPWGRLATAVLAVVDGKLLQLDIGAATLTPGENPAGEPRDTLGFSVASVEAAPGPDLFALGALLRVLQASGALAAARDLSVAYVNERQQFGRALANFQAVQQLLSQFAVEVAAVEAAASGAVAAADCGDASFQIAAAKLRANIAIGVCTAAAHQVHGAIGFTADYALHLLTRRLWSWRSEFGHDGHWAALLGRQVARAGAEGFWPALTAQSDRIAQIGG